MEIINCAKCGAKLPASAKFCMECGEKVSLDVSVASVTKELKGRLMEVLVDKAMWSLKSITDGDPAYQKTDEQIEARFDSLAGEVGVDKLEHVLESMVTATVHNDKTEKAGKTVKAFFHCVCLQSSCETNVILRFLVFASQMGFGKAEYVLGKMVYGRGLAYREEIDGEEKSNIIEMDENKMIKAFKGALESLYPCYGSALDLGVYYMGKGQVKEAQKYLELAMQAGIKDAEIYLRYLEHSCRGKVPAVLGTRTINLYDKKDIKTCSGNIREYKGYIYSYSQIRGDMRYKDYYYRLSRVNIASGVYEELAVINGESSPCKLSSCISDVFCMDNPCPHFSIYNDIIYFSDAEGISTMNLDGTNRKSMPQFLSNSKVCINMPIVFSQFMLYRRNQSIYKYDYASGNSELVNKKGMHTIFGISEKEINFENKIILDLYTLQQKKMGDVYPQLKRKKAEDIWYIDMAREIAYYIERSGDASETCRLIGSDKKGNTVDLWNLDLPHLNKLLMGGYESICFNEHGLSIKYTGYQYFGCTEEFLDWYRQQEKQGRSIVCAVDRMGNERILYNRNEKGAFGTFHLLTENSVIVLEAGNDNHYYASMIPKCSKDSRHTLFAMYI